MIRVQVLGTPQVLDYRDAAAWAKDARRRYAEAVAAPSVVTARGKLRETRREPAAKKRGRR